MKEAICCFAFFIDILNILLAFVLFQILGQVSVKPHGLINKLLVSFSSAIAYFILLFVFLFFIIFAIDSPVTFSLVSFTIFGIITICFILLHKRKTKNKVINKYNSINSKATISKSVSADKFAQKAVNQDNFTEAVINSNKVTNSNKFEKTTKTVDEVTKNEKTAPTEEFIEKIEKWKSSAEDLDPMLEEAINLVVGAGQVSISFLQQHLIIGFARAGRLIDAMEQMGIVGPHAGYENRKVYISEQQWIEIKVIGNIAFNTDNNSEFESDTKQHTYEEEPKHTVNIKFSKSIDTFIDEIIAEQKKEEYERLLNEFIEYAREYINYFFELEDMSVSVSNIYANHNYKTVTAELELSKGIRIGQIKYRLGSLAKYLNVTLVVITTNVTDLSKLGIEISYPNYLLYDANSN